MTRDTTLSADDLDRSIGVFDSGIGGLTVLAALRRELPRERFIYLGDTARVPYGTKSPESVIRYARQAAEFLLSRDVKLLVVACNTASSVALPDLAARLHRVPIVGVTEPGVEAAVAAASHGRIGVIATEGTIRKGRYQELISERIGGADVHSAACSMLVALAEEGWTSGDEAEAVIRRSLRPLEGLGGVYDVDCLLLGCTHFPVLREAIGRVLGPNVKLIDSAETTATAVRELMDRQGIMTRSDEASGATDFLVTDGVERFCRVGSTFLGEPIDPARVDLVDLVHREVGRNF